MKRRGKTAQGKQRYYCFACRKSYLWRCPNSRHQQERIWFERWVKEGYTLHQISDQSGWSQAKLKRIKTYWLNQPVPLMPMAWESERYLIFDGTYFHHTTCLMVLYSQGRVLASCVEKKEGYGEAVAFFSVLKGQGLMPTAITMDGNPHVIRAIGHVWPECVMQRCLYHIKHQSEMWLRQFPKTALARDLKGLLAPLCSIRSQRDRESFQATFVAWKDQYCQELTMLKAGDKVEGDVIRAYKLIEHALPNMFHYLNDPAISSTTNGLEGYFPHLKKRYRGHAGLRPHHLASYLAWYIYFHSKSSTT